MRKREILLIPIEVFVVSLIFFPFLVMIFTSFKPDREIFNPRLLPIAPTYEHYEIVLFRTFVPRFILNSLIVGLSSSVTTTVIAIFGGYSLARYHYRGRDFLGQMILYCQVVAGVTLLIPLYLIMSRVKLVDTYWCLIILYSGFSLPFSVWLIRGFLLNTPLEIEDAARIDGCSEISVVFRIILPMLKPAIFAVSVFAFIWAWNEYLFASVFISSESYKTIPPGIAMFKQLYTREWGQMMAASVLATLPAVLLFFVVQKYFISAIASGSVKG